METLHKSHKIKGLSRKERRLIKRQNAALKEGGKRKVVHKPRLEEASEEPFPALHIPEDILQKIYRIIKEFSKSEEFGIAPVGISPQNHCSYGLKICREKPASQASESTSHEYKE